MRATSKSLQHFVIGDVHGCFAELLRLERKIQAKSQQANVSPVFVSVGDLVDRGPGSAQLIEHFRSHPQNHILVMGNHELLMIETLLEFRPDLFGNNKKPLWLIPLKAQYKWRTGQLLQLSFEDYRVYKKCIWLGNGGHETLESYGSDSTDPKSWKVPKEHLKFLLSCDLFWQHKRAIVTHALAIKSDFALYKKFQSQRTKVKDQRALNSTVQSLLWNREYKTLTPFKKIHLSGHTKSKNVISRFSDNEAVCRLIENLVHFFIVCIGLFMALGLMQLDKTVNSLIAGAGVIGLALGFAFQEITSNFIAGVFIAFRRPYTIGDIVEIDKYHGRVSNINMRTTHITTFQGVVAIIPNKTMFTEPFLNYTSTPEMRMDLKVGVSYGENLRRVKKITLNCLESIPGRDLSKAVELFFNEFDDSSINYDVRVWLMFKDQKDFLKVRDEAVIRIKEAYDANGITIPFPIRTLDFKNKSGNLAPLLDGH